MDLEIEIEAMRVLESALALPPDERMAWLTVQSLPAAVIARARDLLAAAPDTRDFLETPALSAAPASFAPMMPQPGARLGAWELLRPLDAGGMGVVFLARRADGSYEQTVAIKLVRVDEYAGASRRAELIERFDNERRVLARIEHPNVVRIIDGGSSVGGIPYLVMEYVDGVALTTYCERTTLGVAARVDLMARVCDGVQAAHRHLIVHRDIKPHNILVAADGVPRVLDFGIARALVDEHGAQAEATRTALQAMTPAYASPEQVRREPLTTASDVYSLGVVLFELLAGVRPYALEGTSPAQCERIICDTVPPALRKALLLADLPEAERRARMAGIGGDLERIVARALHKDPERRYGSAQALGEDLRRQRDGLPVHAHPDSLGYRALKFVRRHRLGSAAAAIALLAIVTAGAIAVQQAVQARRSAADMVEVNGFLVDVLQVSNPYASGSEVTLAEALDDAAKKVDERFGDRPDLAVDIRYALGQSMLARYRIDAAEPQLLRTLEDSESVFGRNDERSVRTLASLASLRKEQSRIAESKTLYADALQRIEAGGLHDSALHSTIRNDFGVMYLIQEEFADADRELQRALEIGDRADPPISPEERAQTLGNLAHAARGLGNLDRADALYGEVQTIFESLYPHGSPYLAVVLNNRARLARTRGAPKQSFELLKQAVAMHRRSFEGDHVMVLVPMTNLSRQALDLGDLDVASEWGEKAVAMGDRMYVDNDHIYHAQALTTLADIRHSQGRLGDADALLERARASLDGLETPHAGSVSFYEKVRERLCANSGSVARVSCRKS